MLPHMYKKIVTATHIYHGHADPNGATVATNKPLWAIWRETIADGTITYPELNGKPDTSSNYILDNAESLTYVEI